MYIYAWILCGELEQQENTYNKINSLNLFINFLRFFTNMTIFLIEFQSDTYICYTSE